MQNKFLLDAIVYRVTNCNVSKHKISKIFAVRGIVWYEFTDGCKCAEHLLFSDEGEVRAEVNTQIELMNKEIRDNNYKVFLSNVD